MYIQVYMTDVANYGLVIYNRYSSFCRIESNFMKPIHPNFIIGNESFYLNHSILSMILSMTPILKVSTQFLTQKLF